MDNYENRNRVDQVEVEGRSSYVFTCRRLFWRCSDFLRQVIETEHGSFILFRDLALHHVGRRLS